MMKKGEIYWFDFDIPKESKEESENIQLGLRPALILTRSDFNKSVLLVAPISSKEKNLNTHMKISREKYTSFRSDSYILLEQIRAVNVKNFGSFITKLDEFDMFRLDTKLDMFLDMFNSSKNKFSKEIFKTTRYLIRVDSIINSYFNETIYLDKDDLKDLISKRERKFNSLMILCEKLEVDIKRFYKGPIAMTTILNSFLKSSEEII